MIAYVDSEAGAYGGQISNRVNDDGSIVSNALSFISHQCLDDNTYKLTMQGYSYPSRLPVYLCALVSVNSTTRRHASTEMRDGEPWTCPEEFDEKFELNSSGDVVTSNTYTRIRQGSFPVPTETKCINGTAFTGAVPILKDIVDVNKDGPQFPPYENNGPPGHLEGVYVSTKKFLYVVGNDTFAGSNVLQNGELQGIGGTFLSYACDLQLEGYRATLAGELFDMNGTVVHIPQCEAGIRKGNDYTAQWNTNLMVECPTSVTFNQTGLMTDSNMLIREVGNSTDATCNNTPSSACVVGCRSVIVSFISFWVFFRGSFR
jgi:hypothetical protein